MSVFLPYILLCLEVSRTHISHCIPTGSYLIRERGGQYLSHCHLYLP